MTSYLADKTSKVTVNTLRKMKQEGEKIAMLTAYDYTMARLVDSAGTDIILIGDSGSNVMAGNATTLPVTLEEMIFMARSVVRGTQRAFVVCDMPFGSYEESPEQAFRNAARIMKETGADGVKLEGGVEMAPVIRKLTSCGIPVMGHLGLTPQSVKQFGGFGVRAREEAEAIHLQHGAHALEEAGCFGVVLEKIPATLAARVTQELHIFTIGIGAGSDTDGQVLVVNDMLGMDSGFKPKFVRRYADLESVIGDAVGHYVNDVKAGDFPNDSEHY